MLDLGCCVGFAPVAASGGYSLVVVLKLVLVVAPCHGAQILGLTVCSSCGSWAWLLHVMWDLPGPGIKPVSPALAGRFFTTEPPGKPLFIYLSFYLFILVVPCGMRNLSAQTRD